MNSKEKELIKNFILGNLSRDTFIKLYPVNLAENKNYILDGLENAFDEKNPENVEYFISLISFDENWNITPKYVDVFCKLLLESWHYQHENLVSLLQGLKNPNTVDCLFKVALNKPEYMDYDDTYSLARKCIHALGDINTDYAREKLQMLAQSNVPIIKEKAEKQLFYYNR